MRRLLLLTVLASACMGTGTQQQAQRPLSDVEKRYAENPNDRAVNLQLGTEAELSGDLLRAEQYYVRAEALGAPVEEILPRILRVLVRAQRYEEALVRCRDRLAVAPNDRPTRFLFAALLQGRDRTDLAEQQLLTLLRRDDSDGQAHLAIGRLYRDSLKDVDRAVPHLKKYLELEPNGSDAAAVRFELAELGSIPDAPPLEQKP